MVTYVAITEKYSLGLLEMNLFDAISNARVIIAICSFIIRLSVVEVIIRMNNKGELFFQFNHYN